MWFDGAVGSLGKLGSVLGLLTVWALAKYAALLAAVWKPNEYSDTYYYFTSAQEALASGRPLATMTPEYPTPAAALLLAPYLAGGTDYDSYRWNFLVLVVGADALFVLLLAFRTGPAGVLAWTLLESIAGSLALLRLDIVPAVLAGAALLVVLRGRDETAAGLAALGAGVKLWPALLLPLAFGDPRSRSRAAASGVGVGLLLVGLSVAAGGVARLFSPLTYQRDRGLQIESVAATPAMLARLREDGFSVAFTEWHAYEIAGPGVDRALTLADMAALLALVAVVALYAWWFRSRSPVEAAPYLALFVIVAFIVTSKALSPQYLLWLAAPAAVAFGCSVDLGRRPPLSGRAAVTLLWVVGLLVATNYVYPAHYDAILAGERFPTTVLAVRNIGLVGFALWTAAAAVTSILEAGARRTGGPVRLSAPSG